MLRITTLISASWNEITAKTIQLSWRKILPQCNVNQESEAPESTHAASSSMEEFTSMFQTLGHTLTEDEVSEWLESDQHDVRYTHLTDDEIVSRDLRMSLMTLTVMKQPRRLQL